MNLRRNNERKPSGEVWDVFARTRDEAELHHIGDVCAPSTGLARAYAYQMYQESPWVEMMIARRSDIATIVDRT